jgi:hypothetical protein
LHLQYQSKEDGEESKWLDAYAPVLREEVEKVCHFSSWSYYTVLGDYGLARKPAPTDLCANDRRFHLALGTCLETFALDSHAHNSALVAYIFANFGIHPEVGLQSPLVGQLFVSHKCPRDLAGLPRNQMDGTPFEVLMASILASGRGELVWEMHLLMIHSSKMPSFKFYKGIITLFNAVYDDEMRGTDTAGSG